MEITKCLSRKRQMFIAEYMVDLNATQSGDPCEQSLPIRYAPSRRTALI